MRKRLLHFCSYYGTTDVYSNLIEHLDGCEQFQQAVIYARKPRDNRREAPNERVLLLSKCLLIFPTQFLYWTKIAAVSVLAWSGARRYKPSFIHSHTLYADGIPAYLYAKLNRCKPKHIITIRNTDLSVAHKYLPHYRWLAHLALKNAHAIVCISPAYKRAFLSLYGKDYEGKTFFVPNGIDSVYAEKALTNKRNIDRTKISIVYAGSFHSNKNLFNSYMACQLALTDSDWTFTIIGGDYESLVESFPGFVNVDTGNLAFVDRSSRLELIKYFDEANLFLMPSHTETFGLVYLESISRCTPVVYTRNQGFDGVFNEGQVGYSCDSNDVASIAEAITNTLENYKTGLGPFEINPVAAFSWDKIATFYATLFASSAKELGKLADFHTP